MVSSHGKIALLILIRDLAKPVPCRLGLTQQFTKLIISKSEDLCRPTFRGAHGGVPFPIAEECQLAKELPGTKLHGDHIGLVQARQDKLLVEGVNRIKKHERIRTTQRGAKTGGIVTQEAPIHISNVQIVDDQGKPTRIGYRIDDNGQKVRIARSTGKEL